jgi:hypothetical protein
MLRLFAVAGLLAFATSAQAITPAPLPQPDGTAVDKLIRAGLLVAAFAKSWRRE